MALPITSVSSKRHTRVGITSTRDALLRDKSILPEIKLAIRVESSAVASFGDVLARNSRLRGANSFVFGPWVIAKRPRFVKQRKSLPLQSGI